MSLFARVIREPLVHFLVLGAAIFIVFYQVAEPEQTRDDRIVITPQDVERLTDQWRQQWRRSPTEKELDGLIESYIREVVLYREALSLGLDQDDVIVRRRLGQKLEFLFKDIVEQVEPDEQELSSYFDANPERYTAASLMTFIHIFLSRDARGAALEQDARDLLQRVRADPENVDSTKFGDRFLYQYQFENQSQDQIARVFGGKFAEGLFKLDTKKWEGPLESSYGLHLVFIDARTDPQIPSMEDVREQVRLDVLAERRVRADAVFYQGLKQKYDISVERNESAPEGSATNSE